MKALVLEDKNKPLVLKEVPGLKAGPGEVIVHVYAAALNHRDVWIQKGMYAGLKYPLIPGADGAGVVVEIGKGAGAAGLPGLAGLGGSTGFPGLAGVSGSVGLSDPAGWRDPGGWVSKEVIINPSMNWGPHASHQDPHNFKILGLPDDGTFAQCVKVPVSALYEKPAHLSFEEAAAIPLAGLTAYRALITRARLRATEKVLITGIGGGVALFALQYAVAIGARVYVTSGSDEKIERAISLGARGGVNYTKPGWVGALQETAGSFDVTIDGAGGDGMGSLLNLATPGGRLVFYGSTRGNPGALEARRIFWKQLNIFGSTMGSPEDFRDMVAFIGRHSIRPVVDKIIPWADGEAAMRRMDESKQFGKIVLRIH